MDFQIQISKKNELSHQLICIGTYIKFSFELIYIVEFISLLFSFRDENISHDLIIFYRNSFTENRSNQINENENVVLLQIINNFDAYCAQKHNSQIEMNGMQVFCIRLIELSHYCFQTKPNHTEEHKINYYYFFYLENLSLNNHL